jgi:TRAP-type mannitol/chloroaromatic compound transport system permease small subunit
VKSLIQKISALNALVGKSASWLTLALVILICVDVFWRYFFDNSKVWMGELEWHLFASIFLLGAAYTYKDDEHVRVDLFYTHYTEKRKAWINLIGNLLFLIPFCLIIIITSFNYAYTSFLFNEGTPNPGGLPYRFIVKSMISLGFTFLLLQAVGNSLASILIINNKSID